MKLEVVGEPQPQGNKTAFNHPHTGRAILVEGKGKAAVAVKNWREAVANAARDELARVPRPPMDGPIELKVYFRFAPTSSDPYRHHHSVKPDLDKLARAVFDALKMGGAVADDSRICALTTRKRFAFGDEAIGCTIELYSLASEEAEKRETRKQRAALDRRPAPRQAEALPL